MTNEEIVQEAKDVREMNWRNEEREMKRTMSAANNELIDEIQKDIDRLVKNHMLTIKEQLLLRLSYDLLRVVRNQQTQIIQLQNNLEG